MAGFSVLTARGPEEALSLASKFDDLDVAVLDYEMPIMNGATLAERLKLKLPKLNVVVYSAAIDIPSRDLQKIDTLISKSEGITVLICHLWRLSAEIDRAGSGTEAAPLHEAREPPASLRPT